MRVLVTGGHGFIGSAFVREGRSLGNELIVLDLDTYAGDPANLEDCRGDGLVELHGDVREPSTVREAMREVDAVAHFAAESHVDRSIDSPGVFLSTNVLGTGVVLEAAHELGVGRVLVVSSDEVYGSVEEGTSDEQGALAPTSPYAASKAAADLLAQAAHKTYGLDVVITRPCNTYGPHHHPEKLIPLMITRMLDELPVSLYGDGQHVRDWIHVDDHARAQWTVLTGGTAGAVYNIAGGERRTNRDVVESIARVLDRVVEIGSSTDRPGHDRRYAVDDSRLRGLGFLPRWSFEEGIARTVDWFRANESWWRPKVEAGATRRRGLGMEKGS